MKRYDIHWAMLDPVAGAAMGKQRPVVIVSLDTLNARLQTVTICPLTSQLHPLWRTRIQIQCAGKEAEVAVDQIRTLSQARLGAKMGSLTAETVSALRRLISEMYGEG
jgi:mRNA interferase MazF